MDNKNDKKIKEDNENDCEHSDQQKPKRNKSPSKRIRDLRRLLEHKIRNMKRLEQQQQTAETNAETSNKTKVPKWKFWRNKFKTRKIQGNSKTAEESTLTTKHCISETKTNENESPTNARSNKICEDKIVDNPEQTKEGKNLAIPANIYYNFEDAMKLANLEEPQTLNTALRHLIRTINEKGESITFPQVGAVDKIYLKSKNLPTEPNKLKQLVIRIFKRRDEDLDFNEIYSQFVKAHGRIVFDPRQNWPKCYVHSFQP